MPVCDMCGKNKPDVRVIKPNDYVVIGICRECLEEVDE